MHALPGLHVLAFVLSRHPSTDSPLLQVGYTHENDPLPNLNHDLHVRPLVCETKKASMNVFDEEGGEDRVRIVC
jgi:hypothetical protein